MAKDAAPPEAEPPKRKKKLLIIIIAAVAVVAVLAGGVAFFLMSKPAADKHAKAGQGDGAAATDGEGGGVKEEEQARIYEKLDTFTVNLADQESYLQTEVQLLVADAKVQEKIKVHMPEVRDALIRLLSSKTAEDLSQPEGKEKLAQEVQKAVNEVLGVKKASKGVKKVLFAAFIIQ